MLDILTGFAVIGLAIVIGYVVGRIDLLGAEGGPILAKLSFFVLNPFLMVVVLSEADIAMLFSSLLPVSAIAAAVIFLIYGVVAKLLWKRSWGDTVMGALSAGQVNGNNMGIPISTYLLGNAAYSAPIVLLQQIVFTPITLSVLDALSSGETKWWKAVLRAFRNPMVLGSFVGLAVALTGVEIPPIVHEPMQLLANAAVPVILISFGMSLHGRRVLTGPGTRRDALLATAMKILLMPAAAYLIGRFLFGLDDHALFVVTVLGALPTAQNVFNYAQRYNIGLIIARDTVFLTTLGCAPVLVAAALLLG
ncbi:membrane protein [Microbacterium nanhaiense]|uniref:Membrane protein n=1 Tax=Microbacterium nanhaiense TaxID=1301026 RepID=A0ABQ2N682_9MICO|nr:AEC family transporter [Microbacterium nanhaiense]GGO67414.1 membrane protein [Microbacterium nanhaiense]